MTLRINVMYRDENGTQHQVDLGPGGHLAGVEVARYELWGAPIMIELGLEILPQLAKTALLRVESKQLEYLKQEALMIQKNLQKIIQNTSFGEQTIIGRTDNIMKAVEYAQKYNGQVTIG